MEKLNKIYSLCKCSVTISINDHRDYHETAKESLDEIQSMNKSLVEDIGEDIYNKMIETNTIIKVQAYPDTPVGFYSIYHYDLETALDNMIEALTQ